MSTRLTLKQARAKLRAIEQREHRQQKQQSPSAALRAKTAATAPGGLTNQVDRTAPPALINAQGPDQRPVAGIAHRCPYCSLELDRRYVVYRRNAKTQAVVQGQWETVHLTADGDIAGDGKCPKSPLRKYLDVSDPSTYTRIAHEVSRKRSGTVHLKRDAIEQDTLGRAMVTICGALGGRTSASINDVTCHNCRTTIERHNRRTNMSAAETETKPMTVKEKIAAAKARKEAAQGAPGPGKSATLVSKDGPVAKSSAKTATAAGKGKPATEATKAKLRELKEKAKKEPINPCGCGCGTLVKGRFAIGHDARFHGWIKRVGDGRMTIAELPEQVKRGMYPGVKDLPEATRKEGRGVLPKVQEAHYLESLKKN